MSINNKQQAMDLFEKERSEFLEYCRWVARKIVRDQDTITIDDVRSQVELPLNIDGRVFGAVFNRDEWEKIGYAQTKRQSSHGRPIAVFKLKPCLQSGASTGKVGAPRLGNTKGLANCKFTQLGIL